MTTASTTTPAISGRTDPRFAAVRGAFERNFAEHGEIGAGFAVVLEGVVVADLWGGHSDAQRTKLWAPDTVTNVWSTTKGVAAICFAILVDRGQASYEDQVAKFWPEFAAAGKDGVTIAQLLSHQAGLCGFAETVTMEDIADQAKAERLLAAQAPLWTPGAQSGYHAVTYGTLANALFRRIEGRSLAEFLDDELSRPHQLGLSVGLAEERAHLASEIVAPPELSSTDANPVSSPTQQAALANPVLDPLDANKAYWRAAPIPSVNGFATARGLARLYGALANDGVLDGAKLMSAATIADASRSRIEGQDLVLGMEARWAAGFLRNTHNVYGDKSAAFGHSGWGGSFAFADPERKLGLAYVMNRMGQNLIGDPRGLALIEATLKCTDAI
ncbi:MAG: beta-lactamase family protein [Hyphomonas sp.]|uniref:serine hydrolase domain-containing protein n=1 Tax=Hyphomonas sp. TaxID=87 RepID=UPI00181CA19B|nr:serine hydrolase domain-containing protein [Hyphomonas sp.]MBA3069232.1 beta-lactamase family protein [Hyphomonas sp.]MBU3919654.1 beta-lactamase family protein [Alphaproteobacteria bacterium]MBU4061821.1 beta-lactamase family protein [Alphaproteobacteria bacterium]MBU4163347.1 beta-lactamase family protein [Alphaproteobacteria bacterium]